MKRLLAASAALLLAACASVPERFTESQIQAQWAAHRAAVSKIDSWRVEGRVALRAPDQAGSASLIWERTPAQQTIDLFGPFGAGRVRIVYDATGATLKSGTDSYRANDPSTLLHKATGWYLPLDGFDYWVRGLPVPGPGEMAFDAAGRLARLIQSGWTVEYAGYQAVDSTDLPTRIVMRRPTDTDTPLEVRLVIQRWAIAPNPS